MAATIDTSGVELPLNKPSGSVRIADEHGNHVSQPTQALFISGLFVEWMITNEEIGKLMENFLEKEERTELDDKISEVNEFIKECQYATQKQKKPPVRNRLGLRDSPLTKMSKHFTLLRRHSILELR